MVCWFESEWWLHVRRFSTGSESCAGAMLLSDYVRDTLEDVRFEAGIEDDDAWLPTVGFPPREFRFAFVGAFLASNAHKDKEWHRTMKHKLCRIMTTTPAEWDRTYKKGADANAGLAWAMSELHGHADAAGFGADVDDEAGPSTA